MIAHPAGRIAGHARSRGVRVRPCVRVWFLVCFGLGLSTWPNAGSAQGFGVYEVRGGVLAHDVPHLWSGFALEQRAVDVNLELSFTGIDMLGGTLRPVIGGSLNTNGQTSHAYLDARWSIELPWRLFLATGLGVAVHDGLLQPTQADRKALGSSALFHIPVELGLRLDDRNSVSVYFEHTSNAGLANYKEGLDRLGVRYGFRF